MSRWRPEQLTRSGSIELTPMTTPSTTPTDSDEERPRGSPTMSVISNPTQQSLLERLLALREPNGRVHQFKKIVRENKLPDVFDLIHTLAQDPRHAENYQAIVTLLQSPELEPLWLDYLQDKKSFGTLRMGIAYRPHQVKSSNNALAARSHFAIIAGVLIYARIQRLGRLLFSLRSALHEAEQNNFQQAFQHLQQITLDKDFHTESTASIIQQLTLIVQSVQGSTLTPIQLQNIVARCQAIYTEQLPVYQNALKKGEFFGDFRCSDSLFDLYRAEVERAGKQKRPLSPQAIQDFLAHCENAQQHGSLGYLMKAQAYHALAIYHGKISTAANSASFFHAANPAVVACQKEMLSACQTALDLAKSCDDITYNAMGGSTDLSNTSFYYHNDKPLSLQQATQLLIQQSTLRSEEKKSALQQGCAKATALLSHTTTKGCR